MDILVVMKRFGANRDMVLENFGRQIRLFEPLAKKHRIHFLCPDYIKKEKRIIERAGIKFFIEPLSLFSIHTFCSKFKGLLKKGKYGVIFASTDPLIGILCNHYSKKYSIPFFYDLMDNYESYGAYRIPFVKHFDRKAIKDADLVVTVSETLKRRISKLRKNPIKVINNGVDLKLFKPIDKSLARKKLRLPKGKIIVHMGNLESVKGSKILLDAFKKIRSPHIYLFLAGKVEGNLEKNVIHAKSLTKENIVLGINAGDVAVIPNTKNKFSQYCFPYKLPEYMACKVPIVATDLGDVSLVLKKYKGSLCRPNDADDLAEKIRTKLNNPKKVDYKKDLKKLEWKVLSKKLGRLISTRRTSSS